METTFGYLRQFGPLLAERILETYPPLQSTKDPVAHSLGSLLRQALPAQALAITGTAKYLRRAKAVPRRRFASRYRKVALKCELASETSSVSAGLRTGISPSSLVRNCADAARTRSDTPSQWRRNPPSLDGSTRRNSHSSSRTRTRRPGTRVVLVIRSFYPVQLTRVSPLKANIKRSRPGVLPNQEIICAQPTVLKYSFSIMEPQLADPHDQMHGRSVEG